MHIIDNEYSILVKIYLKETEKINLLLVLFYMLGVHIAENLLITSSYTLL